MLIELISVFGSLGFMALVTWLVMRKDWRRWADRDRKEKDERTIEEAKYLVDKINHDQWGTPMPKPLTPPSRIVKEMAWGTEDVFIPSTRQGAVVFAERHPLLGTVLVTDDRTLLLPGEMLQCTKGPPKGPRPPSVLVGIGGTGRVARHPPKSIPH